MLAVVGSTGDYEDIAARGYDAAAVAGRVVDPCYYLVRYHSTRTWSLSPVPPLPSRRPSIGERSPPCCGGGGEVVVVVYGD